MADIERMLEQQINDISLRLAEVPTRDEINYRFDQVEKSVQETKSAVSFALSELVPQIIKSKSSKVSSLWKNPKSLWTTFGSLAVVGVVSFCVLQLIIR